MLGFVAQMYSYHQKLGEGSIHYKVCHCPECADPDTAKINVEGKRLIKQHYNNIYTVKKRT